MPKKLFTLPFLSLRGRYSDTPPPESGPGQVILYFNKEDGKIFSSSDGSPYEPMDEQIRNSVFDDQRFIDVALTADTGGETASYFENGFLKDANTPVSLKNTSIVIDSAGRIQGIGTSDIKVNNEKVFEDPRFTGVGQTASYFENGVLKDASAPLSLKNTNITIDSAGRIQGIGTSDIKVNNEKVFEDPRFAGVEQTAADLGSYLEQAENTLQLKANKIFFKYDGDDKPVPGQQIEITIVKGDSVAGNPALSVNPSNKGIALSQAAPDRYLLTVSEFNKAEAESIEITATVAVTGGTLTDSVTIFKAKDGMNSLVGGLTNPFVAIQVNGSGAVQGNLQEILADAGGVFTVLKGTEDLTGDSSRITYSIETVPEAFLDEENEPTVAINASGIYSFTGFNIDELVGDLTFIATDVLTGQQLRSKFTMVVVRQGADGLPGAGGSGSRTVRLTADDGQIAYRSDDQLLDPSTITIQATQLNHEGTVFYEFVVSEGLSSSEIVLRNTTSNTLVLTSTSTDYGSGVSYTFIEPTKTGFGKNKTVKVRTREGSATAAVSAQDTINIIATRDGSDALEVSFENNNHSFVASALGLVSDYSGGGSRVEAYIGNEQLNAKASGVPSNGEFVVSISTQTDITSGLATVDIGNPKRIIIGDPSGMPNDKDTASVLYTITAKSSNGVQKTQSIKASFSKSKQGVTGSSGVGARSVELVSSAYQFNYDASNQASPTGFTLTATARGTTSTNIKYKFYKDGVVLTSPSQPQTSNTLGPISTLPAANALAGYSVELLEDDAVKAIDSISIYGTRDGSDGVTLIVPNDNHTVTTDSNGVPLALTGSGTSIQLIIGSQGLLATASTLSAGRFRASISGATGISFGASPISVSGADATGKTLLLADATGFSGDSGSATLTVEFVRPGGSSTESVVRTLSYSKSKQGEAGITISFSRPSHSFTAASDGTVSDLTNSGTTIAVSVGSTALNYVSSLSGTAGQFTVSSSVSPANSLTVPTATGTGTSTATVGNVSAGSAFAASNAITVTYTITVRRPGTSSSETFTRTTSYSKSLAGEQGPIGEQGVQGPDGPEGGNPEDIGFFSSVYIRDGIRYPWGWGRTSGVSSSLQTVLNSNTSAPVEEQLIYDPDLAASLQSSALSTKGGYIFAPQTGLTVSTRTFCYSRPIPIDTDYRSKLKFQLAREAATSFGTVTVGAFFLDEGFQKLVASDGNVLHVRAVFANDSSIITTGLRTVLFNFSVSSSAAAAYTPAAQGTLFNYLTPLQSEVSGISVPTDARYAVPFIYISGATNSRLSVATARWWALNPAQVFNGNQIAISSGEVSDTTFNPTRLERLLVLGDVAAVSGRIGAEMSSGVALYAGPSYAAREFEVTGAGIITGRAITLNGENASSFGGDVTISGNTTLTGTLAVNSASTSTIRTLQAGQSGDTATRLTVHGDANFDSGTLFIDASASNVGIGTTAPNSTYKLDVVGSARFDSSTLVVNASTNRVGIGTTSPGEALSVVPATAAGGFGARIGNIFTGFWNPDVDYAVFTHYDVKATNNAYALLQRNDGKTYVNTASGTSLEFRVNNTTQAFVDASNNGNRVVTALFTGQHRSISDSRDLYDPSSTGLIVASAGSYNNVNGYNSISINESLPKVQLTTTRNQQSCFGVISSYEDSDSYEWYSGNITSIINIQQDEKRLIINSLGEGAIWVTNINGNLQNGDYITSCEIPGYGMRQDDGLLHNYTVAKITCDCDFDLASPVYICEEFEFNNQTYRRAFVGCTYHCG